MKDRICMTIATQLDVLHVSTFRNFDIGGLHWFSSEYTHCIDLYRRPTTQAVLCRTATQTHTAELDIPLKSSYQKCLVTYVCVQRRIVTCFFSSFFSTVMLSATDNFH